MNRERALITKMERAMGRPFFPPEVRAGLKAMGKERGSWLGAYQIPPKHTIRAFVRAYIAAKKGE